MSRHDNLKQDESKPDFVHQIAPEFAELDLDIQELQEQGKDPMFVSALLFRLIKEKERSNKLLEALNDKYDRIMLDIKQLTPSGGLRGGELTGPTSTPVGTGVQPDAGRFQMLAVQDDQILKYVEEHSQATAADIKAIMNYKGLNAASQRLNKLHREGYLKKLQRGKRVLYLAKS